MKKSPSLTDALAEFLAGQDISVHDLLAAIKAASPFVHAAVEIIREQKILADFAKLPVLKFVTDIEAARDSVAAEIQKFRKTETELENFRRQQEMSANAPELPPDAGDIAAAILARETWLKNAAALKAANSKLFTVLHATAHALGQLALHQETSNFTIGSWRCYLSGLEILSPIAQAEKLVSVVRYALAEIGELQAGHVPGQNRQRRSIQLWEVDLRFQTLADETA